MALLGFDSFVCFSAIELVSMRLDYFFVFWVGYNWFEPHAYSFLMLATKALEFVSIISFGPFYSWLVLHLNRFPQSFGLVYMLCICFPVFPGLPHLFLTNMRKP